MPTLATSLLQGLKDHGARELFGIPGDFVLPFFKVIEESGILPHYTLSHEPAVGFAADAAARYHSGLGVAVVTFGAGAFNLVNAIAVNGSLACWSTSNSKQFLRISPVTFPPA